MNFNSSQKVHIILRILLHEFSRLKARRKVSKMKKAVVDIVKKITDYLEAVIAEELIVIDAFNAQFD